MLVREVVKQFEDEDSALSGGLLSLTRGALYIERDRHGYDVWFYPTGHNGSASWASISGNHEGQELLEQAADEFTAQLLLDYYLGGHHENRDDL